MVDCSYHCHLTGKKIPSLNLEWDLSVWGLCYPQTCMATAFSLVLCFKNMHVRATGNFTLTLGGSAQIVMSTNVCLNTKT